MNRRGTPAVSVILPVWDAVETLGETLASLRAQTFEDLEIVVQDDGSTDGSGELAQRIASEDERIRVERTGKIGIVAASNRAHERARGDLFVRMDSDDVARPERIARLVEAAAVHPEAAFFASLIRYFPRERVSEGMLRYETWINGIVSHEAIVRNRFVEFPLPHPACAIRRETFEAIGGYRDGDFPEDYEIFLRAWAHGVRFHKVDEVLLDWREGPGRLSKNDPRYALDRFFHLKVRYAVPDLERRGRDVAVLGAGRAGKRWLRAVLDAGLPVRGVLDVHPDRIGQRLRDVPVVGWDRIDRFRGTFLLATMGRPESRAEARTRLEEAGFVEEQDFLCV